MEEIWIENIKKSKLNYKIFSIFEDFTFKDNHLHFRKVK